MTTQGEAKEAVFGRFAEQWNVNDGLYVLDNEPADFSKDQTWLRLTIRNEDSGQETLGPPGGRKFERTARLFIQVFTPLGEGGTKAGDDIAKAVADIFEGITITGGIHFHGVLVREIGPGAGSTQTWYQHNVEARFKYWETR